MFYIYLKIHSETGLKYLGFTAKDPFKYKGSGKYWRRHLRKHGNQHTTEILFQSNDMNEIAKFGKQISEDLDIVSSEEFANLKPENGNTSYEKQYAKTFNHTEETKRKISKNNSRYWKGRTGVQHPATGSSRPDSVEIAKSMGHRNKGKPAWNSGRTDLPKHSDETKKKMSEAKIRISKLKIECPFCRKIGGEPAMKRWHFENCKEKNADSTSQ